MVLNEPSYEKTGFFICENKDADQLRGNREADQRLCFRYTYSTIPLLPTSEISSLSPSSLIVQPGLCRTWSETPKTSFLTTRLKCCLKMPSFCVKFSDNQFLKTVAAALVDFSELPCHAAIHYLLEVSNRAD